MSLTRARVVVLACAASGVLLAFAEACTDGFTPDCSGANAASCGPGNLDAAVDAADASTVIPEASAPVPSDAGDAGPSDSDADAGDGG